MVRSLWKILLKVTLETRNFFANALWPPAASTCSRRSSLTSPISRGDFERLLDIDLAAKRARAQACDMTPLQSTVTNHTPGCLSDAYPQIDVAIANNRIELESPVLRMSALG